jgi:hypothetical protein
MRKPPMKPIIDNIPKLTSVAVIGFSLARFILIAFIVSYKKNHLV